MLRRAANTLIVMALVGISFVALTQWASGVANNPPQFNPALSSTLCGTDPLLLTAGVCDNRPGGVPDHVDGLNIPAPDANFSLVVTFTPSAFCVATMTNDCSGASDPTTGTPSGTHPPALGDQTGDLVSHTSLALTTLPSGLNTTCSGDLPVPFTFFTAITTPRATGIPGIPGNTWPIMTVFGGKVYTDSSHTTLFNGTVAGRKVINGLFDVDTAVSAPPSQLGAGNGTSGDSTDNGVVEYNRVVYHGLVDMDGDAADAVSGLDFTNGDLTSSANSGTIDAGIVAADPVSVPSDPLVIQTQDPDGNGLPNGVDHYPNYMITTLEPAGPPSLTPPFGRPATNNVQLPRLRTYGDSLIQGTTVILQLATFNQGQLANLGGLPYTNMTSSKGWPTEAYLQDPDPFEAGNSTISDFCTPLSTAVITLGTSTAGLLNTGGGAEMLRNPAAISCTTPPCTGDGTSASAGGLSGVGNTGTSFERHIVRSLRDVEPDGLENQFDTCPYTANVDGDPRNENGPVGGDNDGLDSACDPDSSAATGQNLDQDGDGFSNRIDNCPVIANGGPGLNAALDINGNAYDPKSPTQMDTDNASWFKPADGGPPLDGIGNACDLNPTSADGATFFTVENKVGVCVGGNPADPANEDNDKNDAGKSAPDGWCTARENFLGTSDADNCGGPTFPDANVWPPDLKLGDGKANSSDFTQLKLDLKNYINPPNTYVKRDDLNADGKLSVTDRTLEDLLLNTGVPDPSVHPTGPKICVP